MASSEDTLSKAATYYSKGNEAFVEEDYASALQFYTEAINLDESNSNYFSCRAHALQKLDKHAEAKTDADRAIQLNQSNVKAYLRKGISCFNLGEYAEAKAAFVKGQKIEDVGFKQWIAWCDEKLQKQQTSASGPDTSNAADQVTAAPASSAASVPAPAPSQAERIKHDWYQTDTHVCIAILAKNLDPKNVEVNFAENNVSMNAKLPSGSEYVFDVDLAHAVVPQQSTYTVLKTKVEIKLKKAEGLRWTTLEGTGETVTKSAGAAATKDVPSYPSSSRKKKDWDKIEVEIKKEEVEEKPEGEAALNQLFQKIYGEGSDEVRRAMNKSFMESGGTVLSTNWNEVAKDKVTVKPPDGMEYRKWDS